MKRKWIGLVATAAVAAVVLGWMCQLSAAPQGKGKDRILSKITFIHYKKGHAKPPRAAGDKGRPKEEDEGYYDYIAKRAKWKMQEDLFLNLACEENVNGSLESVIAHAVIAGIEEWETPGEATLYIFGTLYENTEVTYDDGAYRGYNTISFGSYEEPDVIAITTVWGYLTGPPDLREIVEAHIQMNDDYVWGDAATDSQLMDIQNIMTHELGHWAGMGDLYELAANEETMYGYSTEGELKKRDLYNGDITGVTKLYQ